MEHQDLYDLHASASDSDGECGDNARNASIVSWLQRHLDHSTRSPAVIELGFGDAALSLTICRRIEGAQLRGLDISGARVARANALATRASLGARARFE